jgi:arginine utilization protein RocB
LLDFVSPEHWGEEVPCHFIPLNKDGETIEDLELQDNQSRIEREVGDWLRAKIRAIEKERAEQASV